MFPVTSLYYNRYLLLITASPLTAKFMFGLTIFSHPNLWGELLLLLLSSSSPPAPPPPLPPPKQFRVQTWYVPLMGVISYKALGSGPYEAPCVSEVLVR